MNNLGRDACNQTNAAVSDTILNLQMNNQEFDPLDMKNKKIINVGTDDPSLFTSDLEAVNKKYVDTKGYKLLKQTSFGNHYTTIEGVEPYHNFLIIVVNFTYEIFIHFYLLTKNVYGVSDERTIFYKNNKWIKYNYLEEEKKFTYFFSYHVSDEEVKNFKITHIFAF